MTDALIHIAVIALFLCWVALALTSDDTTHKQYNPWEEDKSFRDWNDYGY